MSERTIGPGAPDPLGATWDGRGVNFALFSQNATHVELCLFDAAGREARIGAARRTGHVWHVYVWDARPGQRYGWRVHGPYAPREGHRFNPNKLLVDPYARALDGGVDWTGPVYAYPRDRGLDDLSFDDRDDAFAKPKSVVVDGSFDWGDDAPPRTPWDEAVLYELHVKGFTKLHPLVPEGERGTFAGLASDAAIGHLTSLGVTTLELLPVHEHLDEPSVVRRGMTNYWGYSTLAFFAPDRRFATRGGDAVREFKQMVKRLHVAGIEVVLDVVYNHTCEGDELGPTVSWRGIDNLAYYRVRGEDGRHYVDYSGCGNTLDAQQPQVIKLITDSLRYWVTEMHVDGFRFDLAPALARVNGGQFDRLAAFLSVVHQDPVLSRVKLVAEPWDLGSGGYQVGNFPVLWTEWNGRYRDTARAFWRGDPNVVADLGYRLTGSSDLFADDGRSPQASVNFITTHDGFTLRDLVTYEKKHNEDNGEDNKDGLDHNTSQNCGVEGETLDARVRSKRRTIARSLMSMLFVSQGVPMLEMGDELWRTQRGNNNPYCQDSELTWVDWRLDPDKRAMLDLVRSLSALRKRHPALRRNEFLRGVPPPGGRGKDITWLRPDGAEMTPEDWAAPESSALAFRLEGAGADAGEPAGESLLVMMNAEKTAVAFTLPDASLGASWRVAVDTREPARVGDVAPAASTVELDPGSLIVWVDAHAT
ncbi:MAG TPA: glycogen debranching protein GlgX [Polyangiaceae bacterium]|nr:glycogen debranching protein GlgX [Polyangiaceae bacterium]